MIETINLMFSSDDVPHCAQPPVQSGADLASPHNLARVSALKTKYLVNSRYSRVSVPHC